MNYFKTNFKAIIKNQFFTGTLIMVLGSNVYNFSQLIYHFITGRILGKALYGDLATIISILGIIGIIQLSINLTIVKYVASEKDKNKLAGFIKWVYNKSLMLGIIAGIVVVLVTPIISKFFNISQTGSVYLLSPILLFFIAVASGRSILHGLIQFDKYVYDLLAESFGKLIFTCIFLFVGFGLFGAIVGYLAGIVLAFFIIRIFLLKYLKAKSEVNPNIRSFFKYSFAAFLQGISLTSMYTMDLLLVKHFFSPDNAGLYAALAILGRIVFFGTTPITNVMFPIVAKKHLNGEKYYSVLSLSLFAILFVSVILIIFYYLFPVIPIELLYGKGYIGGAGILWWFAVFMCLLSIAMLFTQFYLSIGKTKVVSFFAIAAIFQVILIWFIHSTLLSVIQVSILSSALLVFSLLVYSFYQYRHRL